MNPPSSAPTKSDTDSKTEGSGLTPGDFVAERYRIIRLLGQGQFGEVFKADDTRFNRYVALKISFKGRTGTSRRALVREVKTAQRIAHPNVVRVWELGSFERKDGEKRDFIAAKMIEGETLRAILDRRIGALTANEKLRFAHDLCTGLGATHREGILHRDLKPENVMLSVDGHAIITDFGLASNTGSTPDPHSGTPAYMAPEIKDGKEPSERSDIYSLGLVLFELLTGLPLPDEKTEAGLFPKDNPIEPNIREAILNCLKLDPKNRPRNARSVAESLPPRPSPGPDQQWTTTVETLLVHPTFEPSRSRSWWLFTTALLGLVLAVVLGSQVQVLGAVIRGDPPLVLEYKAKEILRILKVGLPSQSRKIGYAMPRAKSGSEGTSVPQAVFWYRQSPSPLYPRQMGSAFQRYNDPLFTVPGEVGLQLDPQGRLLQLDSVPTEKTSTGQNEREPDWATLLTVAGLDPARFHPVEPSTFPPRFADRREAWEGSILGPPAENFHIEAASLGNTLVYFRRFALNDGAIGWETKPHETSAAGSFTAFVMAGIWFFLVLAAGLFLALLNIRRRTADLQGATRLAVFVFVCRLLVWIVGADHFTSPKEFDILQAHLERGLHSAIRTWILYTALEPFARKYWVKHTASWVRLLRGRFKDSLLGHDLLVGVAFGVALVLCGQIYSLYPRIFGLTTPRLDRIGTLPGLFNDTAISLQCQAILGFGKSLAMAIYTLTHAVVVAFFATVGIVFLRFLIKSGQWSRLVSLTIMTFVLFPAAGHPLADSLAALLVSTIWLTVLIRFGFLATVTATVTSWWLYTSPLSPTLGDWYSGGSMVPVALTLSILIWGFRASLEKRGTTRNEY